MLTEARLEFLIELRGYDGGLGLLPCPPSVPKAHRFQGGLIYSRMIEIEGRVVAPEGLAGRRMRIWLDQLESWHFSRSEPPQIGDIYDRAGELPGAGLETTLAEGGQVLEAEVTPNRPDWLSVLAVKCLRR